MAAHDIYAIAIRTAVFALMVIVGTDCVWAGVRDSLRRPGLVVTVVLGQFLVTPAITYLCCSVFGASMAVTLSLMLIACCPAGSISNSYCFLVGGNTSLSVALTTVSVVASLVMTPLALVGVGAALGTTGEQLPLIPLNPLILALVLMMLAPLVIGGAFRAWKPSWVARHQRLLRLASLLLIVALLALIIASDPIAVGRNLKELFLVTVSSTVLLLGIGWLSARGLRLSPMDRLAVLFEFPCRNLAIAALVGVTVFGRPDLVLFSAALFVVQGVMLLPSLVGIRWLKVRYARGI